MATKKPAKAARKARAPQRNPKPRRNGATKGAGAKSLENRLDSPERNPSERIDRYIAGIPDWRGKVLATIRRIMREADPAVTEDWKWMGSPVWYCDGMIAVANAHRDKVKVTFSKGAHFADPSRLFNAGLEGKEWRAIDTFENDRLDEAKLLRLIKTAIAYNRSQLKSKGKLKADKHKLTN